LSDPTKSIGTGAKKGHGNANKRGKEILLARGKGGRLLHQPMFWGIPPKLLMKGEKTGWVKGNQDPATKRGKE